MPTIDEVPHHQSSSSARKTFAFLPIDGHGHVNAMIGLADQLRSFGHRTVFICNDSTSAKHFGHELVLVRERNTCTTITSQDHEDLRTLTKSSSEGMMKSEENIFIGDERLNSKWAQMVDLLDLNVNKPECVVKSLTHNYSLLKLTIEQEIIPLDERIEQILIDLKPDLVVVDQLTPIPAIHRLSLAHSSSCASGIGIASVIGSGNSPRDDDESKQRVARKEDRKPFLRWISLCSCNPMPLYHDHSLAGQFPPPLMGLSVSHLDSGVSIEVQQLRYERIIRSSGMLGALVKLASMAKLDCSGGRTEIEQELAFRRFCRNESPWLNLYMFPAKLDYAGERGQANLPPDSYQRVDCLIRAPKALTCEEELLLDQVKRWRTKRNNHNDDDDGDGEVGDNGETLTPTKGEEQEDIIVVYVSLGTTMSLNLKLMEALLQQVFACLEAAEKNLERCEQQQQQQQPIPDYRFVISLGARGHLLSTEIRHKLDHWREAGRLLAAGWWPQPELMRRKLVDVGVVHGGNNTICELFYFGIKSIIVVPAFHDQLDNARRVADLGLGVSLPATKLLAASAAKPNDDEHDLLLLQSSLWQALELAQASSSSAHQLSASASSSSSGQRDSYYCARLLESKVASWSENT